MIQPFTIDVAGMRVELHIADELMAAKTREKFANFLSVAGGERTVRVDVRPGAQYIAMTSDVWVIETQLKGERVNYRSFKECGWFDFGSSSGVVELAPEAELENYLRVLYAHLCVRSNALLLHAAGIVRDGKGYVFFGRSGSGKSTTSRLSRAAGCVVLSDDLIVIRKEGAKFRVYGAPFHGTASENPRTRADAELAGVFALAKSDNHYFVPMTVSHAVAALSRSVPFVMGAAQTSNAVIAFCTELARAVPPAELHFRKDDGFWKVIDEYGKAVPRSA